MSVPAVLGGRSADAKRLERRPCEFEHLFATLMPWRGRRVVLVGAAGPFQPDLVVAGSAPVWHGLGCGWGHLRARCLPVEVSGRRAASRSRTARLWLPDPDGAVRLDEGASPAVEHPAARSRRLEEEASAEGLVARSRRLEEEAAAEGLVARSRGLEEEASTAEDLGVQRAPATRAGGRRPLPPAGHEPRGGQLDAPAPPGPPPRRPPARPAPRPRLAPPRLVVVHCPDWPVTAAELAVTDPDAPMAVLAANRVVAAS